jgi:hypothetical protein
VQEIQQAIERFLDASERPVLCEPGEEALAIRRDNFVLEQRNGCLSLHAWDDRRNLMRRVVGIESASRGRLDLRIERFAKRAGTLALADLAQPRNQSLPLRAARREFRDVFRRFLRRQFAGYKIADLSTEANLEETLSPVYPRALLRDGAGAWAAIAAHNDAGQADGVLSFGLIWLDYLRRREPNLTVRGIILYLPAESAKTTCLRLRHLNTGVAEYSAFLYSEDGRECAADLRDFGNLDTRLDPCRRRLSSAIDQTVERLREIAGVESIERSDGELSLRVRGMEFARTSGGTLLAGLETKREVGASNVGEVKRLAQELARLRAPDAADRWNPLYLRNRELWLESQVRAEMSEVDATLVTERVYGQVPAFAASERGVIDLLGVDRSGRLAVIELKAAEDIHLPMQSLDYWMRVQWHSERGEFTSKGYFPGIEVRRDPPRILMISPSLEVHPTNERLLRYYSPSIDVEHVGVGIEWQKKLKVMFRVRCPCP